MDILANPCEGCGLCCKKLIIEIGHLDVVREPKLLDVSVLLDGRGTVTYETDWKKQYMLACGNGGCKMLGDDLKCSIYPTRPNTCVRFEPGCRQCNELRESAGLPMLPAVKEVDDDEDDEWG